jgi:hypothetical protein
MSIDTEAPTVEFPPPPGASNGADEAPKDTSPLELLRAKRKQIHRKTTERFPLPGFNGELVAEFRVLPWEEAVKIERKVAIDRSIDDDRRQITQYADELIAAHVDTLVKQGDELIPADPKAPTTFRHPKLAESLGFSAGSSREVIFGVFREGVGAERADYALNDYHTEVTAWMRGLTAEDAGAAGEADREFSGE